MKLFFKILAFLFVLVVFVAIAAVFFVPRERVKAEIQTAVLEQTGRNLDFADVGLSFFPNLGLTLENVSLSNAEWADSDNMLEIGNVDVVLALAPLLQRQIEIKRFVLDAPLIRLQKHQDGRANWQFESATTGRAETASPQSETEDAGRDIEISFSDFVINNGTLIYSDAATDMEERVEDINVTIRMPNLQSSLDVTGRLDFRGARLNIEAHLDSAQALTGDTDTPTPARLNASMAGTELDFDGHYTPEQETLLDGAVNLSVKNIGNLTRLLDPEAPAENYPVESFTARLNGQLGPALVVYEDLNLNANDTTITGRGRMDMSGERMMITGTYQTEQLNLDPFLAPNEQGAGSGQTESQSEDSAGWSTTPMNFSALNSVNANIDATVGGYQYDGLEIGGNTISLTLQNGLLDLDVSETAAFSGTTSNSVRIDVSGDVPSVRLNSQIANMRARPVLAYFADYEKLSGTMSGNVNVTASGRSAADMTRTLGGFADITFRDGEIEGVNLVDWAKAFQRRLSTVNESYGNTQFVEMGGRFDITNGMARNDNFRLIGPLVEATGSGTVNIPDRTLNYRLVTRLLAAAQSETDENVPSGINMPFNITGSWSDLRIRPDLESIVRDIIRDPESAEENLQNLKDMGESLGDSLKGDGGESRENVDRLKQLFDKF